MAKKVEQPGNEASNPVKVKPYNWTAKRKQAAHLELLRQFNRAEPQHLNSLNVDYLPDGTAVSKTIGRVNKTYSYKMP